jgi:hypothetical protein
MNRMGLGFVAVVMVAPWLNAVVPVVTTAGDV